MLHVRSMLILSMLKVHVYYVRENIQCVTKVTER